MVNSTFVSDAELTTWINQGLADLYDTVVNAFEDYFITITTPTVASGSTIPLPADFYKLRGLDYNNNGTYQALREFSFNERNSSAEGSSFIYLYNQSRQYRILGDNIMLLPEGASVGLYRLFYVPAPTMLAVDASVLAPSLSKFGWDEYIVLFAAERMLSKEESSITDVQGERAEIANRIIAMAANRQVEQSETIQDVRATQDVWGWYES